MLENNKKFRVIEEGVMNQGEMGMTKGGVGLKYDACTGIQYVNTNPDQCLEYTKPYCPDAQAYASCAIYHLCPGRNDYLSCKEGMFHIKL